MGDTRNEPDPFGSEGYAFPHTRTIRHLHISHNAPYLPPTPPPQKKKFFITFLFYFSWVLLVCYTTVLETAV